MLPGPTSGTVAIRPGAVVILIGYYGTIVSFTLVAAFLVLIGFTNVGFTLRLILRFSRGARSGIVVRTLTSLTHNAINGIESFHQQ